MYVRPGYKLTEVGVIPEEWEAVELRRLMPFVTSGSRGWATFYSDTGDLFVRITNLSRESIYLDLADTRFVAIPDHSSEGLRTSLREGDVLISITADIGVIGYVDDRVPLPAYINQHISLVRLDSKNVDGRFIAYFLASEHSQRNFRSLTDAGAKAGMSLQGVERIVTALPPYDEQHAISLSLSDIDVLLERLTHLIAKKRDLKQAAMQQLLTGQTRLPGFQGEWEVKRLAELGRWRGGVTPSMAEAAFWDGGDFPWVSSGDVKVPRLRDTSSRITAWAVHSGAAVVVPAGALLVVMRSGILRKFLPVAVAERDLAINQDIKALIPILGCSSDFLLQLLTFHGPRILETCLKSGTTVESIELAWLKSYTVPVPPLEEQHAVSAVLADMDAELSALEARRDKTRAFKEAMMQELLTGRTRLI